jgi:hypothetical protein
MLTVGDRKLLMAGPIGKTLNYFSGAGLQELRTVPTFRSINRHRSTLAPP